MKKILKIEDAITIANAERLRNGIEKIKDRKHLAEIIAEKLMGEKENIYMRLYRAEKSGFINENEELITAVMSELNVEKAFLISNFDLKPTISDI